MVRDLLDVAQDADGSQRTVQKQRQKSAFRVQICQLNQSLIDDHCDHKKKKNHFLGKFLSFTKDNISIHFLVFIFGRRVWLPWYWEGTSCGDMSTTNGWPNSCGTLWKTQLLSESTMRKSGFRTKGIKSPGYKLRDTENVNSNRTILLNRLNIAIRERNTLKSSWKNVKN